MSPPQEQDPRQDLDGANVDPLPGRVIAGNFRIDQLIGSGAMGNVYKAEQLSLGKAVAVKVLHAHLMGDAKLVMRFKREAKSASLLNHPNSIQIIDSGQDADGTLYIAMELLAGRDLAQVIRDDFPLPLPRVVRVMAQVLSALDEAHTQGVIHRDLKPSNIMLVERRGERDFVKVCDFGIAKATNPDGSDDDRQQMLTIQGLVCGTPEYMAPEQARGEPLDGRADLYAAAVILYQLVTGDIPFKAETPMGLVSRHLAEPPQPPSVRRPDLPIPKIVDEIVLRGMQKTRELRFDNAVAFREALEAVVSMAPGQLTPLPPGARANMPTTPMVNAPSPTGGTGVVPPPRRRFPVVTAAALAVAVAAIAVAVGLRPREEAAVPAALPAPAAMVAPMVPAPSPGPAASARLPPAEPEAEPVVNNAASPAVTPAPAVARASRERSKRHAATDRPIPLIAAPSDSPLAPPVPPPPAAEAPAARGPREILGEGEKLLGQGEVREACARGEEAKKLNPKLPAIYKFLGKCYMRGGDTGQGNDNYKKYLELAPNASDAPFIKSIIK